MVDALESNGIELSIVMPCLNEAETVVTCIRKAQGFLTRSGIVGEIVVADNGSDDGSNSWRSMPVHVSCRSQRQGAMATH